MEPAAKVAAARKVLAALPESHPFRRNTLLGDHERSDAGLYDLLLHARDVPFTADRVMAAVAAAGLGFAGFIEPARYRPESWAGGVLVPEALDAPALAALAEHLCGAMKAHVFYAVKGTPPAALLHPQAVPRLRGIPPAALAAEVAAGRAVAFRRDGTVLRVALPREAAPLLRLLDGRRPLGAVAAAAGLDWLAFAARFAPVHEALTGHGALLYSMRFA
jgi:hypothetical protein